MVMLPNPPPMPRLQATSLALRCGVELVCQMWSGQSWRCNSQRIYWCRFKTQKSQQWCVCTVYQQQQWVFAGEDGWNKRCITINNQVYLAIRKKILVLEDKVVDSTNPRDRFKSWQRKHSERIPNCSFPQIPAIQDMASHVYENTWCHGGVDRTTSTLKLVVDPKSCVGCVSGNFGWQTQHGKEWTQLSVFNHY